MPPNKARPFRPTLVVTVSDDEEYVVAKLRASQYERLSTLTGGSVTNRAELWRSIGRNDPTAWRALTLVMREAAEGKTLAYRDVDVDMDEAEAYFADETGRQVEVKTGPVVPCSKHADSGGDADCDDCDDAVKDELGNLVWVYEGTEETVPTQGPKALSVVPGSTPTSSGSPSGSGSGIPATAG